MTAPTLDWTDLPPHGGNLAWAAQRFGIPEVSWLDLSTGVSPFPYPDVGIAAPSLTALPSTTASDALLSAARRAYGVPAVASCLAAPGSQALLAALPGLRPTPCAVAVLSPTYTEHAAAWGQRGHAVTETSAWEALYDADVAVVVNPNNPDGSVYAADQLLSLADHLAAKGGLLVVDEAFADTMPEVSVVSACGRPGLIVLRSFGKFFGLAGVRLGLAIGETATLDDLRPTFGLWSVSGPALEIGQRALNDLSWQAAQRGALREAVVRLDGVLNRHGLTVVGGTPLFRLVQTERALDLFNVLGQKGILTRIFPAQRTWMRVGLPGNEAEAACLDTALAAWAQKGKLFPAS